MVSVEDFYDAHKSTGFPVDIRGLIKKNGIELREYENLDLEISGEIFCEDNRFIISTNSSDPKPLRSFAMAHEMGHFVFHKSLIGQGVDDNRMFFSTNHGRYNNKQIKKVHEAQANIFACSTLMPVDELSEFVSNSNHTNLDQAAELVDTLESHFSVPLTVMSWWLKIHIDDGGLVENASNDLEHLEQALSEGKRYS